MCRLAIMDKKGFESLDKEFGVYEYMDFLEKSNGGHGNGYALIKDGEILEADKGINLSNEEIYCNIAEKDFDYFIYHTRITSQGSTCDNQCHPFITPQKDFLLCMNGTERTYGDIGKLIGTSDTDAIFRVFHSLEINEENLANFSSRFIGFRKPKRKRKGYVFFTNSSYMGLELATIDGMVVGSCFPKAMKSKAIETNYYWKEGQKIKLKKEVSSYRGYGGKVYSYDEGQYKKWVYICRDCKRISPKGEITCTCGGKTYLDCV